ncbi:MAG: hypothetical protein ACHQ0Y_15375 [Thermodesulfovibrionales bacterium]
MDGVLVAKLDTNGNKKWQKSYGPSIGSISDIQITPDGGYIIIGSTLSSGSGYSNILILKLNANGDIQWQKAYDSTGSDGVGSIQLTSDGGYMLAGITNIPHSSIAVIAKIDANGNIIWWKNYGTGRSGLSSIQKTSDGDYIAAGGSSTGVSSGVSWLLKVDNNGDIPDCQVTAPPTPIKIINMSLTAASDDMIIQDTAVSPATSSATVKDSSVVAASLCVSGTIAVPIGTSFFGFSPTYFPSLEANPTTARPVGVGSILSPSVSSTLSVQIGLLTFTSPVDVYCAYTISTKPGIIKILNPDLTFQSFSFPEIKQTLSNGMLPTGVVPWKSNTAGPIKEALLGAIPASSLPKGTYTIYLLVTPTGRLDSHYLWRTSFLLP